VIKAPTLVLAPPGDLRPQHLAHPGAGAAAVNDPALSPGFSLYLDLLRFSAAVLVLLYHSGLARFGHEAVIVFFVLSGYVISYTAQHRDRTIQRFVLGRITRIYSVAVPVLFMTVILDNIGCRLDPALYVGSAPLHSPVIRFVASLLLLNETWISVQAFSNGPYWSLCYELIYYFIFASWFFFGGRRRIVLVAICMALTGIRPLLLFPIWALGSWCYFETGSRHWSRSVHWGLFLSPTGSWESY
jgi:peptidoglycan/LPS O-acetylase OafA/YrhL